MRVIENFATYLYGEDKAGLWVKKTDTKMLNEYIKPIIYDGLDVQGLENLNAYLYGDEMVALNYPLYCPKCRQETLIEVKNLQVTVIERFDVKTQS